MEFLTILAFIIILIMVVSDKFKTSCYKENDKQRAIKEGRAYYWDNKGKQFSIKTGEEVSDYTDYHVWDPKEKRYRARNGIRNSKTLRHVDWVSGFYDPRW